MPQIDVEMPDGTIIEGVPEGTTQAELQRRLDAANQGAPTPPVGGAFSRPRFGGPQAIKAAGDLAGMLIRNATANIGGAVLGSPVFGEDPEGAARIMENVSGRFSRGPRTPEVASLMEQISPTMEAIDTGLTDAFANVPGGPVAQTIAKTLTLGGAELLGFKGGASGVRGARNIQPSKGTQIRRAVAPQSRAGKALAEIPSTDDLFKAGGEAFTAARQAGAAIKEGVPIRLANDVVDLRESNGLRVVINDSLHPQSHALRNEILDFTSQPMNFDDLLTLRQLAKDASGTVDPKDARVALMMRKQIDDFIDTLSADDLQGGTPQVASQFLKEGRDLWRRARNAEKIEELIELAGQKASQFSGSGFENALTTEFRNFARRIIKGQETSFSPAEAALIKEIGRGGDNITKLARDVGRLAPKNFLNMAAGAGAAGFFGGPVAAAAVPVFGAIGRGVATRRGINSVVQLDRALRGGLLGSRGDVSSLRRATSIEELLNR